MGGRWVGGALTRAGIKLNTNHTDGGNKNSYRDLQDRNPALLKGAFLFTFVRHPVAWYRSYWSCRTEDGWRDDWLDKYNRDDTFDGFLKKIIKHGRPWVSEMYEYYIGSPQVMDFVGLNEDMSNGLIKILHILNARFDEKPILELAPVNISVSKPSCSKESIDSIIALEDDTIQKYYKDTPYEKYVYDFASGEKK